MNANPERVNQILDYAKHVRVIGDKWNVPHISEATAEFIKNLLTSTQPKHILELGTATGYSALQMIAAVWDFGTDIHTIDISTPSAERANTHFKALKLQDRITLTFGNALDVLPSLPHNHYDFIFIDAEKKRTRDFLQLTLNMCTHPATIVVDDVIKFKYKMEGLYDFVEQLTQQGTVSHSIHQTDSDDGVMLIHVPPAN